jgi:hypothetical protein
MLGLQDQLNPDRSRKDMVYDDMVDSWVDLATSV